MSGEAPIRILRPKRVRVHCRCACGGWLTVRGSTDAEFAAEALGWVLADDGTWRCPDCAKGDDK